MGAKPTKIERQSSRKQMVCGNQTTEDKLQAISASHIAEFETDSDSEQETNQEQLDIDVLLNVESDNELLDSPPQV